MRAALTISCLIVLSPAVRGFTVNLLGRYYTQRLIDENRAGEEDAIPIFLRTEQIAAYARYVGRPDTEDDRILAEECWSVGSHGSRPSQTAHDVHRLHSSVLP